MAWKQGRLKIPDAGATSHPGKIPGYSELNRPNSASHLKGGNTKFWIDMPGEENICFVYPWRTIK